jgi:O-antigen ligase
MFKITMISMAVLWILRNNEYINSLFHESGNWFSMVGTLLMLVQLMASPKKSVIAIFSVRANAFTHALRFFVLTMLVTAIFAQNLVRTYEYIILALIFNAYIINLVEGRWRMGDVLVKDFVFVYYILASFILISFLLYATESPIGVSNDRFQGVTNNPNFFGLISVLKISIAPAVFYYSSSKKLRLLILIVTPLTFVMLFASQSRGSFLALIISFSVYAILKWRLLILLITGASIIILSYLVMSRELSSIVYVFKRPDNDDEISAGRFEIWTQVYNILSDSWIWFSGIGFRGSEEFTDGIAVHNVYLQVLFELGIFGLIAFIFIFVVVMASCYGRKGVSVLMIPTLAIFSYDLVESSLIGYGNYLTLIAWMILGFAISFGRYKNRSLILKESLNSEKRI